ncbi:MAG: hypothetical protein ACMX3H_10155 [Sodalis sp. (in: enterobacteria)]|uniref:hypothetical protein n=1 Tax=Sodalis sp. (in: enterobacteria) TaxID=1898979 RepID=UPI0039E50258
MEHILTGPYNKPTNNSRRPPRGAYVGRRFPFYHLFQFVNHRHRAADIVSRRQRF